MFSPAEDFLGTAAPCQRVGRQWPRSRPHRFPEAAHMDKGGDAAAAAPPSAVRTINPVVTLKRLDAAVSA